jgi:hypothetical protein
MGLCLEETCKLEWRSVEPRKKQKPIPSPPRSHCNSTLLCPLASMLTPRSTVCHALFLAPWIFRAMIHDTISNLGCRIGAVFGRYRIRLNHRSESNAETSAMTAAAAENKALISMSFFSSTSLAFRDW